MKTIFVITFILTIVNIETSYPQNNHSDKNNSPIRIEALNIKSKYSNTDGSSGNVKTILQNSDLNTTVACAPQGSRRYIKACYLITPSEMTNSQFGMSTVETVGWTWIALEIQSFTAGGSLKVYLENTANTSYSKGTNFATAISTMTKVIDGTISIPGSEGTYNIDVPTGGPGTSAFSTISGAGLYIAFEYMTSGTLATPIGSPTVSANDSLSGSIALYTSQSVNSNTLSISDFRPETRLGDAEPDTVEVSNIYALGQIPIPWGFPDTIGINLINNQPHGSNEINVKSINEDNNQIVMDTTFSIGGSITLRYVALPTLYYPQNDLVIVKAIPGNVLDHQLQYCHTVTSNAFNHADPCQPPDGGLGFTGSTGNFVAGFNNYSAQPFPIDFIDHCFINDSGGGSLAYNIIILDENGSGQPGPILFISPPLISPPGNTSSQKVTYALPSPVIIPGNRKFFVGYRQTHTVNISACFQDEIPVRGKTFFYSTPFNSNLWVDFAHDSAFYRLDISPRTCKNLKLKVYLEGFFNGTKMIPDKAITEMRTFISPYNLIEADTSYLDSNGVGYFNFPSSDTSTYYFAVKHRNHIETWSQQSGVKLDSCDKLYDFTTSASKAYGNNMVSITYLLSNSSANAFALFAGDVNQDGFVDASDCSLVNNDSYNFVTGYVSTDLNGDSIVDATDGAYCDNNAFNFVSAIKP